MLSYLVNKEVQRSKDNIAELIERLCKANLSLINQQVPTERRASWVPYGRKQSTIFSLDKLGIHFQIIGDSKLKMEVEVSIVTKT